MDFVHTTKLAIDRFDFEMTFLSPLRKRLHILLVKRGEEEEKFESTEYAPSRFEELLASHRQATATVSRKSTEENEAKRKHQQQRRDPKALISVIFNFCRKSLELVRSFTSRATRILQISLYT